MARVGGAVYRRILAGCALTCYKPDLAGPNNFAPRISIPFNSDGKRTSYIETICTKAGAWISVVVAYSVFTAGPEAPSDNSSLQKGTKQ